MMVLDKGTFHRISEQLLCLSASQSFNKVASEDSQLMHNQDKSLMVILSKIWWTGYYSTNKIPKMVKKSLVAILQHASTYKGGIAGLITSYRVLFLEISIFVGSIVAHIVERFSKYVVRSS